MEQEQHQPQELEVTPERVADLSDAELADFKEFVVEKYNMAEETLNRIGKEQERRAHEKFALQGWDY